MRSALRRLMAVTLLLNSGCASAIVSSPAPTAAPVFLEPVAAEGGDRRFGLLSRYHHANVVEGEAITVEVDSTPRTFSVYRFDSFESWRRFHELEPWEQDDAGWPAHNEIEIWLEGLELTGQAEEAQRVVNELAVSCAYQGLHEEPGEQRDPQSPCAEPSLWAEAFQRVGYRGCRSERVGVAAIEGRPRDGEDRLAAVHVIVGRRCPAGPLDLVPFAIREGAEPSLLLELTWPNETGGYNRDLYVFSPSLEVQLRRRLFTGGARRGAAADARYWFEDRDADGVVELVVERFSVEGPPRCVSSDGASLVRDLEEEARITSELERSGCRRGDVERVVLRYDAVRGLWL